MVKKASPWLRSLLRAAKKQQRISSRAVDALLTITTPPSPKKARVRKGLAKATAVLAPRIGPAVGIVPSALAKPSRSASRLRARATPGPALELPGQWLASLFTAPGSHGVPHSMLYWLYLPSTPIPPQGFPLLVMLHGCDQNANLFAQGTRMNALAERKGYAVLYPQQSVTSHPQACWKWYDRATQQGGGDAGHIAGIARLVAATHSIDRSRIYIAGFSAGGAMAHIVALNNPELVAGVGVHSSPLFGAARGAVGAMRVMLHGDAARTEPAVAELLVRQPGFPGMPTILIQGEDDPVVRSINQSQLERQSLLLNRVPDGAHVEITVKERTSRSNGYRLRDVVVNRKRVLRVVRIAGLKHAWSGGDDSLVFNSGLGPDARLMLLDFFSRHRRTAPLIPVKAKSQDGAQKR